MVRKFFSAGVALLLVAGVTLAADKGSDKKAGPHNVAFGKVVSLNVTDGVGTLTVMAHKARGDEATEMKFKVTKDTQFVKGGGPGQEGTPIDAGQLSDTFKTDATVAVRYEGEGDTLTAKRVSAVTPRKKPDNK